MMSNTIKSVSKPEEIISIMKGWLAETLGDAVEFMLPELAVMFLEDVPDILSQMRTAIGEKNADGLKDFAHTLKGSSASMGLQKFASLCQEIEALAKMGDLDQTPMMFTNIEAEYEQVKAALEQLTG